MKGKYTIEVDLGTLAVEVECDQDEGFDGDENELQQQVESMVRDEIIDKMYEDEGWWSVSATFK